MYNRLNITHATSCTQYIGPPEASAMMSKMDFLLPRMMALAFSAFSVLSKSPGCSSWSYNTNINSTNKWKLSTGITHAWQWASLIFSSGSCWSIAAMVAATCSWSRSLKTSNNHKYIHRQNDRGYTNSPQLCPSFDGTHHDLARTLSRNNNTYVQDNHTHAHTNNTTTRTLSRNNNTYLQDNHTQQQYIYKTIK